MLPFVNSSIIIIIFRNALFLSVRFNTARLNRKLPNDSLKSTPYSYQYVR
jgi:hypothetical protein